MEYRRRTLLWKAEWQQHRLGNHGNMQAITVNRRWPLHLQVMGNGAHQTLEMIEGKRLWKVQGWNKMSVEGKGGGSVKGGEALVLFRAKGSGHLFTKGTNCRGQTKPLLQWTKGLAAEDSLAQLYTRPFRSNLWHQRWTKKCGRIG